MGNLSIHLTRLYLGGNQLSGTMPVEFGNFINLNVLGMEANLFTGTIPDSIGKLQRLQGGWQLSGNKLSGKRPYTLANMTELVVLYLEVNYFNGVFLQILRTVTFCNC
ncbi:hypothetical protein CsSME_00000973 [Camellia sinensis var. sinensis]